ncbi:MAG: M3 family metallopeptidase [Muribaculaceae bacterium]|nr:M3 family metallopeptidase [Muribaculaceae bacterium]
MKKVLITVLALVALTLVSCSEKKSNENNPFMMDYENEYGIPPFDKITYADYKPAVLAGIEEQNAEIDSIIKNTAEPNFENTILALDNSGKTLTKVSALLYALSESDNTKEMQKLTETLMPKLTAQSDAMYMNDSLFAKVKAAYDNADKLGMDPIQKRLTEKYYKKFVRNGALLTAAQKDSLKEINRKLGEFNLKFGNNIQHDLSECVFFVDNKDELAGLPETIIENAAKLAAEKGKKGQWAFNAIAATRLPVLTYADSRDLRRKMYETYTSTASHGDEYDNSENIRNILLLRQQKANLLGFNTYADYATDPYMAKTPKAAEDLLMQLWRPAIKKVDEEVADMQKYAAAHGDTAQIEACDYYYYAEKVKAEKFNFSEDDVRPYFVLDSVVKNGIFFAANKLYGLTFEEMPDAPKYNPEVKVYDVKDAEGKHLAVFMTDYLPRPVKSPGAWMNAMQEAYNYGGENVRPIIYNVGNMALPSGDTPSLLTWDDVQTVFHEFGHALHGMLTRVQYRGLAGTNTDRDFVELPSQINEHWAFEPEVLKNYARHYKTGEVIPDSLVQKLNESAQFNMGFMTTELVGAALMDLYWHKKAWTADEAKNIDVKAFEQDVKNQLNMPALVEFRYRSPYFKHVFASDEYACGYYTYLWAQVLDADGYMAFEKAGCFDKATADAFKKLLESGDTMDPMELYKQFRGQLPNADALLRNRGLK